MACGVARAGVRGACRSRVACVEAHAGRRLLGRVVHPGVAVLARLRDCGLVAVRVPCRVRLRDGVCGADVAMASCLVAVQRVELARVALVPSEEVVDGLAEASAAALVVLVLGGHRVRSSVVVEVVVALWDSPCSNASISDR